MDSIHGAADVFLGATDVASEGTWLWVSGEPLGYTNWGMFEPNNGGAGGPENCLLMLAAGSWNDADCSPTTRPFACERD